MVTADDTLHTRDMELSHPPIPSISSIVFNGLISNCNSSAKLLTIADIQAPESTRLVIGIPSTIAGALLASPIYLTNGSGLWYSGILSISLKDPPVVPILLVTVGDWLPVPGEEDPPLLSPPHASFPIPYYLLSVLH